MSEMQVKRNRRNPRRVAVNVLIHVLLGILAVIWVLPIFWIVRWVDVAIHRRKNIGRKLRLVGQMDDEKLLQRERAMNLMGMNFDCGEDDDD
jgi:hypothetical protein